MHNVEELVGKGNKSGTHVPDDFTDTAIARHNS
jgi:hypothetical protein